MTCLALNAQTIQGKVVRVSDGDTITILDDGKVEEKIRLNRIDAPEKKQAFVGSEPMYAVKEKEMQTIDEAREHCWFVGEGIEK